MRYDFERGSSKTNKNASNLYRITKNIGDIIYIWKSLETYHKGPMHCYNKKQKKIFG